MAPKRRMPRFRALAMGHSQQPRVLLVSRRHLASQLNSLLVLCTLRLLGKSARDT